MTQVTCPTGRHSHPTEFIETDQSLEDVASALADISIDYRSEFLPGFEKISLALDIQDREALQEALQAEPRRTDAAYMSALVSYVDMLAREDSPRDISRDLVYRFAEHADKAAVAEFIADRLIAHTDPSIRELAIRSLGRGAHESVWERLMERAERDDVCSVRVAAAGSLASSEIPGELIERLTEISRYDERVSESVARSLLKTNQSQEEREAFYRMVADTYSTYRGGFRIATQALATSPSPENIAVLAKAAKNHGAEYPEEHALEALYKMGTVESVAAALRVDRKLDADFISSNLDLNRFVSNTKFRIGEMFHGEEGKDLRYLENQLEGALPYPRAYHVLAALVASDDPRGLEVVIKQLNGFHNQYYLPLVNGWRERRREAAAHALRESSDPRAKEALAHAAEQDPSKKIRREVSSWI